MGHEGNVHTVSVRNGRIFSGSADNTIKVVIVFVIAVFFYSDKYTTPGLGY